jgi:ribosomal protein L11 methylase PrmA
MRRILTLTLVGLVALAFNERTSLVQGQEQKERPKLTVPYVPTPQDVVEKMLELAQVTKDDVVYDLGCGDGRIVVTAAKKYGAKGVGVDLDPERVKDSLANVKKAGVEKLVTIREGDVLKTDVSNATVVCLYLLPNVNLQLRPILQKQLKPGARIVCHDFDMGDWKPVKTVEVSDKDGSDHTLYLFKIEGKGDKPQPKAGEAKDEARGLTADATQLLALNQEKPQREPDVIFVPTPTEVVDRMLQLAQVKKGDVVYDLGCGDGRIVVRAAQKYGVKAIGIDIDPKRVAESMENVKKNNVEKMVTIKHGDIFVEDISDANVVTLYLLESLNKKLKPKLSKLKPGTRIVSQTFSMPGAKPDKVETVKANGREYTIYLWTVPFKDEK